MIHIEWYFYSVIGLVGIAMLYNVIKDIINAKDKKLRAMIYCGVLAVCAIFYIALRTYAAEPLSKAYFWLAGLG